MLFSQKLLASIIGISALAITLSGCTSESENSVTESDTISAAISSATESAPTSNTPITPAGPAEKACTYSAEAAPAAKPATAPATNQPTTGLVTVTLNTNQGLIPLNIDRALAPCNAAAIISLASQKFFDATNCHRLTTAEILKVLQCGDPTGLGSGGPGFNSPDEFPTHLTSLDGEVSNYPRGTIAIANTGSPNSGSSQFFLVIGDSMLPPKYTVIGTIDPIGFEQVLDRVLTAGVAPGGDPADGAPAIGVTINSATQ